MEEFDINAIENIENVENIINQLNELIEDTDVINVKLMQLIDRMSDSGLLKALNRKLSNQCKDVNDRLNLLNALSHSSILANYLCKSTSDLHLLLPDVKIRNHKFLEERKKLMLHTHQ